MSRVWKRFFAKLAEPLGFGLYFFVTVSLAEYVAEVLEYGKEGYIAVWGVMVIIPIFVIMIRMMWRQAKDEVDRENQDMLNTLKGD